MSKRKEMLDSERLIRLHYLTKMASALQTKLLQFEYELDAANVKGVDAQLNKARSAINTLVGHVGGEHRKLSRAMDDEDDEA